MSMRVDLRVTVTTEDNISAEKILYLFRRALDSTEFRRFARVDAELLQRTKPRQLSHPQLSSNSDVRWRLAVPHAELQREVHHSQVILARDNGAEGLLVRCQCGCEYTLTIDEADNSTVHMCPARCGRGVVISR